MKIKNIVLIGAGNVAYNYADIIIKKGFNLCQVYSYTRLTAQTFAQKFNIEWTSEPLKLLKDADLYIIAIKDSEIETIVNKIKINNALVVHTAGSVNSELLRKCSANYGVLYPLQTLQKNKFIDFYNNVPLLIEANNNQNLNTLEKFAEQLSNNVRIFSSEQRKSIHIAAVFACNFTKYMYHCSDLLLKDNNLPFELLLPLIKHTVETVEMDNNLTNMTGPAARGDYKIVATHLAYLSKYKDLKNIYSAITKEILDDSKL
ncbi:MAG: DUF2520 domain-containing protein [Bacteroidales bacterium]|nr:DUF2520 domain-containing protein [Bacteroidales bacterium]